MPTSPNTCPADPGTTNPSANANCCCTNAKFINFQAAPNPKVSPLFHCASIFATASPRWKSLLPRAKSPGTAVRTSAPRKLAAKRNKLFIATGGDSHIMQITLDTKPFATLDTDALVTYVFEESDLTQARLAELDKLTGG